MRSKKKALDVDVKLANDHKPQRRPPADQVLNKAIQRRLQPTIAFDHLHAFAFNPPGTRNIEVHMRLQRQRPRFERA